MGFKISPAIGLVMSELLLEGSGKTVDISSFRPSRFADGKPIKAEFEYEDDYDLLGCPHYYLGCHPEQSEGPQSARTHI